MLPILTTPIIHFIETIILIFFIGFLAYEDAFKEIGKIRVCVVLSGLIILCLYSLMFYDIKFTITNVVGIILLLYYIIYGIAKFNTAPFWKLYTVIVVALFTIIGLTHNTLIYYAFAYALTSLSFAFGDMTEKPSLKGLNILSLLLPMEIALFALYYKGLIPMTIFGLLQMLIPYILFTGGSLGGGDLLVLNLIILYYPLIGYAIYFVSPIVSEILKHTSPKNIPRIIHNRETGEVVIVKNLKDSEIIQKFMSKEEIQRMNVVEKKLKNAILLLIESWIVAKFPILLPLLYDIYRRGKMFGNYSSLFLKIIKGFAIVAIIGGLIDFIVIKQFLHINPITTIPPIILGLILAIYNCVVISKLLNKKTGMFLTGILLLWLILYKVHIISFSFPTDIYFLLIYPFASSLSLLCLSLLISAKVECMQQRIGIGVPFCISIFVSFLILLGLYSIINYGGGDEIVKFISHLKENIAIH